MRLQPNRAGHSPSTCAIKQLHCRCDKSQHSTSFDGDAIQTYHVFNIGMIIGLEQRMLEKEEADEVQLEKEEADEVQLETVKVVHEGRKESIWPTC